MQQQALRLWKMTTNSRGRLHYDKRLGRSVQETDHNLPGPQENKLHLRTRSHIRYLGSNTKRDYRVSIYTPTKHRSVYHNWNQTTNFHHPFKTPLLGWLRDSQMRTLGGVLFLNNQAIDTCSSNSPFFSIPLGSISVGVMWLFIPKGLYMLYMSNV